MPMVILVRIGHEIKNASIREGLNTRVFDLITAGYRRLEGGCCRSRQRCERHIRYLHG